MLIWQAYFVNDSKKFDALDLLIKELVELYTKKHKNKPKMCSINPILSRITLELPDIDIVYTEYTPKREIWLSESEMI